MDIIAQCIIMYAHKYHLCVMVYKRRPSGVIVEWFPVEKGTYTAAKYHDVVDQGHCWLASHVYI